MEDVSGEMGPHPRGDTALPTQLTDVSTATRRGTPQPPCQGLERWETQPGVGLRRQMVAGRIGNSHRLKAACMGSVCFDCSSQQESFLPAALGQVPAAVEGLWTPPIRATGNMATCKK